MPNRINIETATRTTETDDTLVLRPDGAGGVEFVTDTGGGGGSGNQDGGNATSTYGGTTPADGGPA